ncbi:MAG: molecular chaperone DnaJ, partial [Firmicutes bacterium]|nr:molecular chaperone DnaJ [Bacillota bacterium]
MLNERYFKEVETLEDLKRQYRTLAMKNHPDRGGDAELMKA